MNVRWIPFSWDSSWSSSETILSQLIVLKSQVSPYGVDFSLLYSVSRRFLLEHELLQIPQR